MSIVTVTKNVKQNSVCNKHVFCMTSSYNYLFRTQINTKEDSKYKQIDARMLSYLEVLNVIIIFDLCLYFEL